MPGTGNTAPIRKIVKSLGPALIANTNVSGFPGVLNLVQMRPWVISVLIGAVVALHAFGADSGSEDAFLKGSLSVEMHGPGAAPFGIASAILGSTSMAYNLGRLQQMDFEPRSLFDADEAYAGDLDFTLRPISRNRWELEELIFRYTFRDQTRLDYDAQARMWDSMSDMGDVRYADGAWQGPPGWNPAFEPKIDLRLFRAETAAKCDDPEALGLLARARQIVSDTTSWTTCYELQVTVAHPMRPTGTSRWESPIGAVAIEAADGKLSFQGEGGALDPRDLPIPPNAPREAVESMKTFQAMYEAVELFLESGLPTLDSDLDMTWERTFRGPVAGGVRDSLIYAILTGATVIERYDVPLVDLVVEKVDETWQPKEKGDAPPVEVRVKPRSPESEPVPLRFTIFEVTRERGTCLNSQDEGTDLDLWVSTAGNGKFQAPEKRDDGWVVETRAPEKEVALEVESLDFGAWGRVKVEGKFGDRWIPLEIEGSDKEYTTIPRDERGDRENQVWDRWEERMAVEAGADGSEDLDVVPGSDYAGDGLSLYEEYRGFFVFGEHLRTDPERKTVLIHVQRGSGLYDFAKAVAGPTDLEVQVIRAEEFRGINRRVVNPNRGLHTLTDQHGLYLKNEHLEEGTKGIAEPFGCIGESPGCWEVVKVDRSKFLQCPNPQWDACGFQQRCRERRQVDQRDLQETVTHEILHALGAQHHGDNDPRKTALCLDVDVVDDCGVSNYYPPPCDDSGDAIQAYVAHPGGEHAGDQRCVMAYDSADVFKVRSPGGLVWATKPGSRFLREYEHAPTYLQICTQATGTLFNQGDGVGDAIRGRCRNQIRVSDQR